MAVEDKPNAADECSEWACPRCGAKQWRVESTYRVAGGNIRRRRICNACGQGQIRTTENPDAKR